VTRACLDANSSFKNTLGIEGPEDKLTKQDYSALLESFNKSLFTACHMGHVKVVSTLMDAAFVDCSAKQPLPWGPFNVNSAVCAWLANGNIFHVACMFGRNTLVHYLLTCDYFNQLKCLLVNEDSEGRLPIHCAINGEYIEIVRQLLKCGAYDNQLLNDILSSVPSSPLSELVASYCD